MSSGQAQWQEMQNKANAYTGMLRRLNKMMGKYAERNQVDRVTEIDEVIADLLVVMYGNPEEAQNG